MYIVHCTIGFIGTYMYVPWTYKGLISAEFYSNSRFLPLLAPLLFFTGNMCLVTPLEFLY